MPAMRDESPPAREPRVEMAVLTLEGTLDAAAASDLLEGLQRQLLQSNRVVLDLDGVTEADSAGLGALVRALKAARDAGGDLVLARPRPEVASIMNEIGLDQVLCVVGDLPEARSRLSKT